MVNSDPTGPTLYGKFKPIFTMKGATPFSYLNNTEINHFFDKLDKNIESIIRTLKSELTRICNKHTPCNRQNYMIRYAAKNLQKENNLKFYQQLTQRRPTKPKFTEKTDFYKSASNMIPLNAYIKGNII